MREPKQNSVCKTQVVLMEMRYFLVLSKLHCISRQCVDQFVKFSTWLSLPLVDFCFWAKSCLL